MSFFETIINMLSSLFGKKAAEQPSAQTRPTVVPETRPGYIEGTDMTEGTFLALIGSNVKYEAEIKKKLQEGCAKGRYPFTFTVGGMDYTISKLPDEKDHGLYGLMGGANPHHN